ncbi:DNA polymerase/3'-5' exonuclease PolX [Cytophaga hutchinsonii]|uniref:DNA polymerase IV, family X n=1 Tax=Cytophaga hutchinsonii (strain ATCC 33406 / DSM 1761 / CIP 103989 / NBRC 15051 / NCIMB 9469 / D465) TaxID=269798 RepID=A0A6N4SNB6_CYTH3|nr:DNA polymerase/3'-5' exonuclease PolX [Cytophaga hutchinsonii]ABG57754.1 DNA polymerase IV, family X [Cytophaga hutchinsonii ATCC 33406]SFX47356.1 DNA polymerase (family 10) [Cytophaga hutchinsonii ATCC 33406]
MTNQEIADILLLTASLMELHDENSFKVRSIQNAGFQIEKTEVALFGLSLPELEKQDGIGKSIAAKIVELSQTGKLTELETLKLNTPEGIVELLDIKGIGPKKVKTLWKELNITCKEELLESCKTNAVAQLKGFGEKTQENIIQVLQFVMKQSDKHLYGDIEALAFELERKLKADISPQIQLCGDVRRMMETIDCISFVVPSTDFAETVSVLQTLSYLSEDPAKSGLYRWRGAERLKNIPVEIYLTTAEKFGSELFKHSSGEKHLRLKSPSGKTFLHLATTTAFATEAALYEHVNLPVIPSELREGYREMQLATNNLLSELITDADIKGSFHNHSTYSDGKHTLEEMAKECMALGYAYFGISDHSKSAFYANGLDETRIARQQAEVDALTISLPGIKIFKGVESDILNDGSLDYADEVLKTFDFIVASIHSNLKMNEEKATQRLITAIENPYTTMLGHPTGRLLLKREGYPIDHKKIIDACAANNVIIEINAHPWRLDMDWRHIGYALDKGCIISINPDAHEKIGLQDMHFGVCVARKAGLCKEQTFNAWPLEKVSSWLASKGK